jgi:hypothetical protein
MRCACMRLACLGINRPWLLAQWEPDGRPRRNFTDALLQEKKGQFPPESIVKTYLNTFKNRMFVIPCEWAVCLNGRLPVQLRHLH